MIIFKEEKEGWKELFEKKLIKVWNEKKKSSRY